MVLTTYGRSSGFCVDPIEKKPLNHFLPGTPVLSFGTAGCNLSCRFCQNWDISKSREMDTLADEASPVCNVITGNSIYDVTTANGFADVYLAERGGPPAGAQLTVEGTGGSNSAYILANNTLAGSSQFTDEGANTSQVAIGACGVFP